MDSQLVIRIPEQEKRLLQLNAKSQAISVGGLVRRAIRMYIEKEQSPKTLDPLERLVKISEKYNHLKSPTDLSVKYKKYLYGKGRIE